MRDLLGGRAAGARDLLDVGVLLGLRVGGGGHLALGHALAAHDEVDQRSHPRHEDQQHRPAGLPPAAERLVPEYNLPANFFLYVGSIIARKNLLTVCKAMLQLKGTLNVPLVVIGEGKKYKRKVKEFVNAHSLQSQIIFLSENQSLKSLKSFQSSIDFPALYQQALCMIYPSIFEGFGIPVLEALWSKIPVITSNISSLPEAGGDAALFVDPISAVQIADAMLTVYTNAKLRKKLIDKGWQYAQNFVPEKTAACVMNVYKDLS